MTSLALFCSSFTNEKEFIDKLVALSGYKIVTDDDIIDDVSEKFSIGRNKVEHAVFGKTSVFNQFTLERERCVAYMKAVLADRLGKEGPAIYNGLTSLLIPPEVTHVLRILVADKREGRMERAVAGGMSEKDAHKQIKKEDQSAFGWTDFLFKKDAFDSTLYDIVIPMGTLSVDEAVKLIDENTKKTAVLRTEASMAAVKDFALAAKAELALIDKGHTVEVKSQDAHVTLYVNKSTLNFSKLSHDLYVIVNNVPGVKDIEVKKGKEYRTSIYRNQEFVLPPKVLLVDDEREFVQTLSERLISRNVGSYAVYDGEQALTFLDDDKPDVMVLDLKMPGIDGIEVLRKTKEANPNIEIIILTGHGTEDDRKTCMDLGAFAYLQKPADIEKLSSTINAAYQKIAERESA